ncbi:cytochrome P450 [Mollisia scopiformis]|uniref:Cytochrome P450 n=1 Tax=Mollisia scopiformis TaxID=149040 RepID=A0A194XXI6_MOLSC|nr:cytochrome P450 [Mollisia scopiformis]KUJ24522.1 cytochrome P450 [Mollisia scopiformis]
MILQLVTAALALLGSYLFMRVRHTRLKQYATFPQLRPSLILGHLGIMGGFVRSGKPKGHPDLALAAMNEALGRPPLMFVDLRPAGPPMVVVRSHEVAEQISKASERFPHSLPKMSEVYEHMIYMTGPTSILSSQGEDWKLLRKRYNAGFAPQYLLAFLPRILERSFTFLGHLDDLVASCQSFSLVNLTRNLTFDIIGSVVMDCNFGAQNKNQRTDFTNTYQALLRTYEGEQIDLPWYFTPRVEWRRRQLAGRVRETLRTVVGDAFNKRNHQTAPNKSRSILSLSLQDVDVLTDRAIDEACDQLSTFLFAGHDTTSILLSWMFYELYRTPHVLRALHDELNSLFGLDSNPSVVRDILLSDRGHDILNRMTYTSAIIKETLRLWPPAGTVRTLPLGTHLKIETSNGEYMLEEGAVIYSCATMIHRDPEVYADTANDFVPERWLPNVANQIPISAWRGFERGPRNCIGQELATLEARIVVALIARRYDFSKDGIGEITLDEARKPILDVKGRFKVAEEMYQTRELVSKPVDGMMMRVKRH